MVKELVNLSEFARRIGISRRSVAYALQKGKFKAQIVEGKKLVDPVAAKKEWDSNKLKGRNPSGKAKPKTVEKPPPVPTYEGMTTADAERKKKVWEARLSELKYLEQAKELVRKDDVEREAFASGRTVRNVIMGVSARFAHELAAETDPHKLELHLNKILAKALEQGMRGASEKKK